MFHDSRAGVNLAYAEPSIPRFNATKALKPCQLTHKSALWFNQVGFCKGNHDALQTPFVM